VKQRRELCLQVLDSRQSFFLGVLTPAELPEPVAPLVGHRQRHGSRSFAPGDIAPVDLAAEHHCGFWADRG